METLRDNLNEILAIYVPRYSPTDPGYESAQKYSRCFIDAIIHFNYPEFVSEYTPLTMYQVLTDIGNHVIYNMEKSGINTDQIEYIKSKYRSARWKTHSMWPEILGSKEQTFPHRMYIGFESDNLFKAVFAVNKDADSTKILYRYMFNVMDLWCCSDNNYQIIGQFVASPYLTDKEKELLILRTFPNEKNPFGERILPICIKYVSEIPELKYLIAVACADTNRKSDFYTDEETIKILLEFEKVMEEYRNGHAHGMPPIVGENSYSLDAEYCLVSMHWEKRANVWSDQQCCDIMTKNMTNHTDREHPKKYAELREKFYLAKRGESPQLLTIANNSTDMKIKCLINGETVVLLPTGRYVLKGLRDKGITCVRLSVIIVETDQILYKMRSIETNIYVAIYGSLMKPKFNIYFEPDASMDNMIPTSEMVRKVAKTSQKEYTVQQRMYPSLTLDDFIRGLGCDQIGTEHAHTRFAYKFNNLMRPCQLQKAIQIILGEC
jgi:hypothetical protein